MGQNNQKGITSKVTPKGDDLLTLSIPNTSITSNDPIDPMTLKRKELLDSYRLKQSFRVAIGKSTWTPYESFNEAYNLREILNDEIVIEFDHEDRNLTWKAILDTAVKLYEAGLIFQIWEHGGKSPHLHIHNLDIAHLEQSKRALFKKLFIRKYVDLEFLPYVDFSLTGIHLLAIEYSFHWKGKYSYKVLWNEYNPEVKQ